MSDDQHDMIEQAACEATPTAESILAAIRRREPAPVERRSRRRTSRVDNSCAGHLQTIRRRQLAALRLPPLADGRRDPAATRAKDGTTP